MRSAIYPGTFDPVTNGHLDILERACRIFDRVIIAVAPNRGKNPLFTVAERMEFIRPNLPESGHAELTTFEGLLVDFARDNHVSAMIRGLRAVSDFEFEFQMTQMNRELDPEIETIFFMPTQDYFFTSSTIIKQVARYDPGRIERFVPLNVAAALKKRFDH